MRKTVQKEVAYCDKCGAECEFGITDCLRCGVGHCYECSKTEGKRYSHGVNFSGSGDGYYCRACDVDLTKIGGDKRHAAYRAVESLQLERNAWATDFQRRKEVAEAAVKALANNGE